MSQLNAMKQIGFRTMVTRIELLEWSNKMDLIALANDKGEVSIQRLNWQKVCAFPSPGEHIKIRAISWQPDERIIAIAYSNGKVALMDVEKENEIHSMQCNGDIKTLNWTKGSTTIKEGDRYNTFSKSDHEDFLCNLPNLSSFSSTARKTDYSRLNSFSENSPNFLVVTLLSGEILLSVYGVLACGTIKIQDYVNNPDDYQVYDVRMRSSFDEVFVFVRDENILKLLVFENHILSKYTTPLLRLATKHGHVLGTLNYINDTVQCIVEAWEAVPLEIDSKLSKYSEGRPEGAVTADFLDLLLFGYTTEPLELFLTRDLTEKGLKKLGSSIELSYSTIQSLTVRPLRNAAVNLFFHLNIIRGMSLNTFCYRDLLTKEGTHNALTNAGSFLKKLLEIHQTIFHSINDYKIFFCWLYAAILRLMDESVPDEVACTTQEDTHYLAEFLTNFDDATYVKEDGTTGKRKFHLERVGQYMVDRPLDFPQQFDETHQWNQLFKDNKCLRDCPLMFPHQREFSLIQQHNALKKSIAELFDRPNKTISESFAVKRVFKCAEIRKDDPISISFTNDENEPRNLLAICLKKSQIIFFESCSNRDIKSAKLNLTDGGCMGDQNRFKALGEITLEDMKFYNESILSMLLTGTVDGEKVSSYFIQMPLNDIRTKLSLHENVDVIDFTYSTVCLNAFEFLDQNYFKPIDGFRCAQIAVSGSRKVAAVVSDNSKKIGLYEMEIEDDDDEMDTSNNTFLDHSKESVPSII